MTSSEPELLKRALKGDEGSFTALYRIKRGAMYRFAVQMMGSVEIAEDVTQEVFLLLLKLGHRYDASRGTVAAFLYGIARNLLRRRLDHRETDAPPAEPVDSEDLLEDLTR